MKTSLPPPLIAEETSSDGLSYEEKLRQAYAAGETKRPQYLSASLRDLFEVTLNRELLLFRNEETETPVTRRKKWLQWYNEIYNSLRCTHNVNALLLYWVTGIVSYELREMERCLAGIREREREKSGEQQLPPQGQGVPDENVTFEGEKSLEAIQHAMELRNVIRRLPALVAFFFAWDMNLGDTSKFEELLHKVIIDNFSEGAELLLLEQLLTWTLRWCRQLQWKGTNSSAKLPPPLRQQLQTALADICQLIMLFSCDARTAERRIIVTALRSVVEGCEMYFNRHALLAMLERKANNVETRQVFVLERWPQYWLSELTILGDIPSVDKEWVKAIMLNMALLWNPESLSGEGMASGVEGSPVDADDTYLFHLLLLTLQPMFDNLFGVPAVDNKEFTPSTANSQSVEALSTERTTSGEKKDPLKLLLEVADVMACIGSPLCRDIHYWDCIGVGPLLTQNVANGNKDIGSFVMASVCRRLLQEQIPLSVNSFLLSNDAPKKQLQRLITYLIRTERVFDCLCGIQALKACLLGTRTSDNDTKGCFYYILETALANHQHQLRGASALVEELLYNVYEYLLRGNETSPATGNGSLSGNEDLRAALRIIQGLSGRTQLFSFYKENLAIRLLSILHPKPHDNAVSTEELRHERLQFEGSMCRYLMELFPGDREAVQHMVQMCEDVKTANEMSEAFNQQQMQDIGNAALSVKLTTSILSPHAWPVYPKLERVPRPLKNTMDGFSAFYQNRHSTRRLIWIRTTFERVTFDIAYPRGKKLVTGSLEHYEIFNCLSEAAGAGVTWENLAKEVEWETAKLQQELRKPIFNGLLVLPQEEEAKVAERADTASQQALRLNPEFTSSHTHFNLLPERSQRKQLTTCTRTNEKAAKGLQETRIGAIQAAVMHRLKTVQHGSYKDLFQFTQESLRHHFQLSDVEFKEVLRRLIDKEYIVRDQEDREQFVYRA
ncbi:hypothetical protein, conserved [Trypanosoma brucei brucei TREU927]|uniref:Cullin family profile domain-containing protein n=1 Tax=Trypanosoma brucei brucei (strain 927/4 GUTat10.1) TaxID=185431 RepID=Q583G1_TRYB2|nr:hypothetical protein, conserved [Trypanosoma brucei brucei TREU927]AAX80494.1 hypothetical protein, conserved [Trypanosoma brucei]AAZ11066.1 hypothetical protein, conserved [Trypanosoma brucei brucei TREU927]